MLMASTILTNTKHVDVWKAQIAELPQRVTPDSKKEVGPCCQRSDQRQRLIKTINIYESYKFKNNTSWCKRNWILYNLKFFLTSWQTWAPNIGGLAASLRNLKVAAGFSPFHVLGTIWPDGPDRSPPSFGRWTVILQHITPQATREVFWVAGFQIIRIPRLKVPHRTGKPKTSCVTDLPQWGIKRKLSVWQYHSYVLTYMLVAKMSPI